VTEYPNSDQSEESKNPSWLTIFSIWNCMLGSSIVSLPANVKDAGIIPTICKIKYIFLNS
jgi:hypothetical protein